MVGQGFQVAVVVVLAILLKLNILGSIFNGKIVFENEAPRTATLSPLVSLIVGEPSVYKAHKTKPVKQSNPRNPPRVAAGVRCGARTHDTQNHNLVLYQLN